MRQAYIPRETIREQSLLSTFFIFVSAHQEMQNSFSVSYPFFGLFSLKKSINENSKIYSIEALAWGLFFLMRLRLYKSVEKGSCLDLKR